MIAVGCILWAVMAAAFCTTTSVSALSLSLWAVTGIGLALIIPNVQSTIAGEAPSLPCGSSHTALCAAAGLVHSFQWQKQIRCADFHIEGDRGTAFGALQMTSLLGGAFGALFATNMGAELC